MRFLYAGIFFGVEKIWLVLTIMCRLAYLFNVLLFNNEINVIYA